MTKLDLIRKHYLQWKVRSGDLSVRMQNIRLRGDELFLIFEVDKGLGNYGVDNIETVASLREEVVREIAEYFNIKIIQVMV